MLGRTFVPKREEVAGDWMKLPTEELRDLYLAVNVIGSSCSERAAGRPIQGLISSTGKRFYSSPKASRMAADGPSLVCRGYHVYKIYGL